MEGRTIDTDQEKCHMKHEILRWGVLSTAKIGMEHVTPAMIEGERCEVVAIASRNRGTAEKAAEELGIERAYGSYEALLEDPDIQAVYIPLPNHLHLEWIGKAVRAGKHVLCEKPLVLRSSEIAELKQLSRESGKLIGEGFMVLHQPRWQRVRELVQNGSLGRFVHAQSVFSFFLDDPGNIRNKPEYGGGGIFDIGCYPTVLSRYVLNEEPQRVLASVELDPDFGVDRLASVILQFPSGPVTFTVSTQMVDFQYFQFFGTEKMVELQTPFNTPDFRSMTIKVNSGNILEAPKVAETFSPVNQYTRQGDAFARAVFEGAKFAGSLDNAAKNLKVLEAIFRAAESGRWEEVK